MSRSRAERVTYCPDCEGQLTEPGRCKLCGWKLDEGSSRGSAHRPAPSSLHHRCAYMHGERRCPLPGTLSGPARKPVWYCFVHIEPINRLSGDDADRVLDELEQHKAHFLRERYGQARRPPEVPTANATGRVSDLVRFGDETDEEYATRLHRHITKLGKGAVV